MAILPYTTENHEFNILFHQGLAIVNVPVIDSEDEMINNPISKEEFREMIVSAKVKGIEKVEFHTRYGIEILNYSLKSTLLYNNVKIIKGNQDKIPPVTLYSKYLKIASILFNISINECRNRYGLYTMEQWINLFTKNN